MTDTVHKHSEKYLFGNPAAWINESDNPAVKGAYQAYLTGSLNHENYRLIESHFHQLIKLLPEKIRSKSHKADILYYSVKWNVAFLVNMGLTLETREIAIAADWIIKNFQLEDGSFSHAWKPAQGDALHTGDMTRVLYRAGIRGNRIDRSFSWISSHQRHDSGWLYAPVYSLTDSLKLTFFLKSGNGLSRETHQDVSSCLYSTVACLTALMTREKSKETSSLENASEFLIRSLLTGNLGKYTAPVRRLWNRKPGSPGIPILMQYDHLAFLQILNHVEKQDNELFSLLFNHAIGLQDTQGRWTCHNQSAGMLRPGKWFNQEDLNRLLTIRILNFLKQMD